MAGRPKDPAGIAKNWTRVYLDINPEQNHMLNIRAVEMRISKKKLIETIIGDWYGKKQSKK